MPDLLINDSFLHYATCTYLAVIKIVRKDYWTIAMVKSVLKFYIRVCRVVYT